MRILLGSADPARASLLRSALARYEHEFTDAKDGVAAFHAALGRPHDLLLLDYDLPRMSAVELLRRLHALDHVVSPPALVLTDRDEDRRRIESLALDGTEALNSPFSARLFADRVERIFDRRVNVACIGGGTGLFTLLSGLKSIPGIRLTSIVSMSDDGGSTGLLRDRFGVLPPGDVRRSLIALSNAPDLLNRLMQYRFERGFEFNGHSLGNLILTALSEMRGSMSAAVRSLGEILDTRGDVVPVTETVNTLRAELADGSVLNGEHRIDVGNGSGPGHRIVRLWCSPPARANPDALRAIRRADVIVIGPGDLYTSIVSNLVVAGIPEAISESPAVKIYVSNVMTKPGETGGFSAADHVRELVGYLQADCLDHILCSSTRFSDEALEHYASLEQEPVCVDPDAAFAAVTRAKVHRADVASAEVLVRHDSRKLAAELRSLLSEKRPIRGLTQTSR